MDREPSTTIGIDKSFYAAGLAETHRHFCRSNKKLRCVFSSSFARFIFLWPFLRVAFLLFPQNNQPIIFLTTPRTNYLLYVLLVLRISY